MFEILTTGGISDFDPSYFTFTGNLTQYGVFEITESGGSLFLQFTSTVPEPGTYALLGLLLLAGVWYRRKRHA